MRSGLPNGRASPYKCTPEGDTLATPNQGIQLTLYHFFNSPGIPLGLAGHHGHADCMPPTGPGPSLHAITLSTSNYVESPDTIFEQHLCLSLNNLKFESL